MKFLIMLSLITGFVGCSSHKSQPVRNISSIGHSLNSNGVILNENGEIKHVDYLEATGRDENGIKLEADICEKLFPGYHLTSVEELPSVFENFSVEEIDEAGNCAGPLTGGERHARGCRNFDGYVLSTFDGKTSKAVAWHSRYFKLDDSSQNRIFLWTASESKINTMVFPIVLNITNKYGDSGLGTTDRSGKLAVSCIKNH